ncbi:BQ2448_3496 [Microbotryum intermedium]|uniref:BQ2448_3496 protein n=1 Tax=Microbotryum intermedium TaxID=269621 RepID=A0A238FFS9_9BASI|nr:BQ2448_3496 [Microbotryum intermedium]
MAMPGGFYADSDDGNGRNVSPATQERLQVMSDLLEDDEAPAYTMPAVFHRMPEDDDYENEWAGVTPLGEMDNVGSFTYSGVDEVIFDDDQEEEEEEEEDVVEHATEVDDDNDDDEADADADGPSGGGGPALRIAFDPTSRQILIVDDNGHAAQLTHRHLRGTGTTLASIRRMFLAQLVPGMRGRGLGAQENEDDEDEEEEEAADDDDDDDEEGEDSGGYDDPYWGPASRTTKNYYDIPKEPVPAGVRLERSGEFGPPPKKYAESERKFGDYSPNVSRTLRERDLNVGRMPKSWLAHDLVPNNSGVEVTQLQAKVYSGQYSTDGAFFYIARRAIDAAAKNFKIYVYDTKEPRRTGNKSVIEAASVAPRRNRLYGGTWEHRSSMKVIKTIQANAIACQWTVTDASLSVDNEWMLYASISPYVHLVKTGGGGNNGVWDLDEQQEMLDFTNGSRRDIGGIWSVRFSNDGTEVVAGASSGAIIVYDIESKRSILNVRGHQDDVNAVAFADSASSNVVISGSDDSFVKVWDRRSMSGQQAAGTLVGHTEGVTQFVAPKGDGRYCLSNGKDQGTKLWDIRKMTSNADFDRLRLDVKHYGIPNWDYRGGYYAKPRHKQHPHDCSVMTYRGHAVLRTLIRCHFSPAVTTDQQYVYSGSSDGKIHIWSLDGTLVQKINRRYTHPLINAETGDYNDPFDWQLRSSKGKSGGMVMVRDVSWHPYRPELMSTAWCNGHGGECIEGDLALHAWKGASGESLADRAERERLESTGEQ